MILESKIWLTLGFISSMIAYTIFPFIWSGAWYDLTAFSFVSYTRVIYLQTHGNWSIYAFIVWLTTVNTFMDELFFNPEIIELNEYAGFTIMVLIVLKYKKKWIR